MNNCPNCNTSFIGDPIPEDKLQHYSETHYRKDVVGIDGGRLGIYDGLVSYQCQKCLHYFPRSDSDWAKGVFNKFMEKMEPKECPFCETPCNNEHCAYTKPEEE